MQMILTVRWYDSSALFRTMENAQANLLLAAVITRIERTKTVELVFDLNFRFAENPNFLRVAVECWGPTR